MVSKGELLIDGYQIIDEDEHQYVLSKKVRSIPWPICLGLGLLFLPLVLLVFWKKSDVKFVPKVGV